MILENESQLLDVFLICQGVAFFVKKSTRLAVQQMFVPKDRKHRKVPSFLGNWIAGFGVVISGSCFCFWNYMIAPENTELNLMENASLEDHSSIHPKKDRKIVPRKHLEFQDGPPNMMLFNIHPRLTNLRQ